MIGLGHRDGLMAREWTWITPELVKTARGLAGWSRKDLAVRAGLPLSTAARFEHGHPCSPAQRMQIVFAFSRARIRFLQHRGRLGVRKMICGLYRQ